jgi:hypothetical protein
VISLLMKVGLPQPIRIERGYPGPGFVVGEDPRGNAELMAALKRAGKLR